MALIDAGHLDEGDGFIWKGDAYKVVSNDGERMTVRLTHSQNELKDWKPIRESHEEKFNTSCPVLFEKI